jgi:hypothetical protein
VNGSVPDFGSAVVDAVAAATRAVGGVSTCATGCFPYSSAAADVLAVEVGFSDAPDAA